MIQSGVTKVMFVRNTRGDVEMPSQSLRCREATDEIQHECQ